MDFFYNFEKKDCYQYQMEKRYTKEEKEILYFWILEFILKVSWIQQTTPRKPNKITERNLYS